MCLHQPMRRYDGGAVGLEQALDVAACQAGFELADLISSQHVAANAACRHDAALISRRSEAGFGLEDLQPTHRTHEILGTRQRDQLTMCVVGARDQRLQRVGDLPDACVASGKQETDQPRCDARQITPAHADGAVAIEQHARDVAPQGGRAVRHHGAGDDAAGIAERGRGARRARVDQRDRVAVALQMQRAGDADYPCTDDSDTHHLASSVMANLSGFCLGQFPIFAFRLARYRARAADGTTRFDSRRQGQQHKEQDDDHHGFGNHSVRAG